MTTYLEVLKAQVKALEIEYDYMCESDLYDQEDCDSFLDLVSKRQEELRKYEASLWINCH